MSHHFDYPQDETLDISDIYVFDGAGNGSGPRTVFGMNTSPTYGAPWNTAPAYGAWAADQLLPDVLRFTPGTVALWNPWFDVHSGKGLSEDIASNIINMVVNQDFSSGLQPGPLLDYFRFLSPPPPANP